MWFAFHLLTVAVLAVFVELICTVLRPRPAVCHLLWLAVLIKLMTPPVVSWPWALPGSGGLERFAVLELAPAPAEEPAMPNGHQLARAAASSASPAAPQPFAIDMVSTGIGLWIVGAVCAAILQAVRLRKLRRISRRTSPAPDWLDSLAAEMAQRLEVRPPRVLLAEGLCSAVAFNAWRPKVLVSHELIGAIPREDFAGILAHELAHLKRCDLWAGLLEFAAQCVWWWNPLLYVVRRRLHLYREMAADAWVLWALPDGRRTYAETLVRVVDLASRQPAPMAAFGMASGPASAFERRLAMVLEAASPCRLPRVTLAATLLLLVLIAPGWSTARPEAAAPAAAVDESPAPAPVPATAGGEPEMVADLRAWFVVPKLRGSSGKKIGAEAGNGTPQLLGLITCSLGPGELVVGGKPVVMQGNELRWGNDQEPTGGDVVQIFATTVGLRSDEGTVIKAVPPERFQQLRGLAGLELSFRPAQEGLRAWIKTVREGNDTPLSAPCTFLHLTIPRDQWQAILMNIAAPKGKRAGTLMLFWKVRPATPELLDQVENGDTDDCRITHSPAVPFTGIYATAVFKIIEVPEDEYQELQAVLMPPVMGGMGGGDAGISGYGGGGIAVTSEKPPVYHLQDPQAVLDVLNSNQSKAELLSAPRVTFAVATVPPGIKVLQRGDDTFDNLLETSQALAEFWEDARPTAVIADLRTETFVDRSKNRVQMHEGLIAAIAAKQDEGADTIAARVLVEDLRLQRHKRGLAFWKPRRLPDVLSNPVEVNFTCTLGETVAFEAPTPKPATRRLILLTIDKAEHL